LHDVSTNVGMFLVVFFQFLLRSCFLILEQGTDSSQIHESTTLK